MRESVRFEALAGGEHAVDDLSLTGRPRFSSQKTTFDRPDIGPISISCSRPTRLAGTGGVDGVHQRAIALAERLDHRRGVHAGRAFGTRRRR